MKKLNINLRFAKYFKPLEPEQRDRLRESLLTDRTTEPVIYWNQTEDIVDGHNRYEIALEEGIELETHGKDFESEDHALQWIIRNQTMRRNLDKFERDQALRNAVSLAIKLEGKGVSEAVKETALLQNCSERTIYNALAEPKSIVAKFRETKSEFEARITKKLQKAAEQHAIVAKKEGWDEEVTIDKWEQIAANLQEEFEGDPAARELEEMAAEVELAVEDNPSLKRELSPKKSGRGGKTSQALASKKRKLKTYEGLLKKVEALYLDVTFDNDLILPKFTDIYASIERIRAKFPVAKGRFGR